MMRVRLTVAVLVLFCATAAGAVTNITPVVNSDPVMCARLLQMVKAADIPHMTDKQLCEFRFSQLSPSVTKGFTFPRWRKLQVADGPALYVKMLHANRAPGSVAAEPNYAKERRSAEKAAHKGVLAFYTTQVPISAVTINASSPTPPTAGSNQWTIVSMRQTKCPSEVPEIGGRYWIYSIFEQPELRIPVPINSPPGGELALWYGKLVVLSIPPYWLKIGSEPLGIYVSLDNFWWALGGDTFPNGMSGGTHCSFSISKQEQE